MRLNKNAAATIAPSSPFILNVIIMCCFGKANLDLQLHTANLECIGFVYNSLFANIAPVWKKKFNP